MKRGLIAVVCLLAFVAPMAMAQSGQFLLSKTVLETLFLSTILLTQQILSLAPDHKLAVLAGTVCLTVQPTIPV